MKLTKLNLKIFQQLLTNILISILIALFSLGFWTLLSLNFTPIYYMCIDKFQLVTITGFDKNILIKEFKTLIHYLQFPWITKLKFDYFIMSPQGEIHFIDVKHIFIGIYIFLFIALCLTILFMFKVDNIELMKYIKSLNYFFYIVIIFVVSLLCSIFFDFSKTFNTFHQIIFKNDYWLFDPIKDPIINALPEELFMLYAVIILLFLILQGIIFKIIYKKRK